jgi:hypothetical protein
MNDKRKAPIPNSQRQRLVSLYSKMSVLTSPECAKACRSPHSCCSPEYCELAIQWAKEKWGIDLERVNGRSIRGECLPLLGASGCTCAPHLRPICTIHTCQINSLGFKPGDEKWTKKYFDLRENIEALEWTDDLENMEKQL